MKQLSVFSRSTRAYLSCMIAAYACCGKFIEPASAVNPPNADFTAIMGIDAVSFAPAMQQDDAVQWLWEFGDGTQSTEKYPQHHYDSACIFSVRLIAQNSAGGDTALKAVYASPDFAAAAYAPNSTLAVFFPNGGEVLHPGDSVTIRIGVLPSAWDIVSQDMGMLTVLLKAGSENLLISTSHRIHFDRADLTFDWIVPDSIAGLDPDGKLISVPLVDDSCLIRFDLYAETDELYSDISDGFFKIAAQ